MTASPLAGHDASVGLRCANDAIVFESVLDCALLAAQESEALPGRTALDWRSMQRPRGIVPPRLDEHSFYGRDAFEVQTIDSGWLLEHSSGASMGYVRAEWSMHCPVQPAPDTCMVVEVCLHDIMVRPGMQKRGFGRAMLNHVVRAIERHAHGLRQYDALNALPWTIDCKANTISDQGVRALSSLKTGLNNVFNGNSKKALHSNLSSGQWR